MQPAKKPPTIEDLDALPVGVKGEIIEGILYTMTRPRGPHQNIIADVSADVRGPFPKSRGGPGGWWILPEPGIELPNTPEIAPDVAGWRKERLPELPKNDPIRVVPDWLCEILSPTTRRHNLIVKKPYYAKIGVPHLWIIDSEDRTLTAYRLQDGLWVELGVWAEETEARIEPFVDVALNVASWC